MAKKLTKKQLYNDCFNLDITIAEFVIPRLIHFRDNCIGYPSEFRSIKSWKKCLTKMIISFELLASDDIFMFTEKQKKQCDEGLQLFAKYLYGLWL